jgi:osmotically-inducible protein OsmY
MLELELLHSQVEGNMTIGRPAFWILALLCLSGIACRTNESPEAQVDDLQITAQLKSRFASDIGASSVTNISVNSTNGVVTMSGQVDTAEARAKAEAIAKSVPKVVRVVDNLQVATKP